MAGVLTMCCYANHITVRSVAQDQIQTAFNALLSSSPRAALMTDATGKIVVCNTALRSCLSASTPDPVGSLLSELVHADYAALATASTGPVHLAQVAEPTRAWLEPVVNADDSA